MIGKQVSTVYFISVPI